MTNYTQEVGAEVALKQTQYWTIWGGPGYEQICSKHKLLVNAISEVYRCERAGGMKHKILKVQQVEFR